MTILTVDIMTERTKNSECPEPLASIIRVHNAWIAFENAKPKDVLAMRTAFLLVCGSASKTSGIEIPKLQAAAKMLPDAINVNLGLSRYGIHPEPIETIRILQWMLINKSFIPWPQEEIDRFNEMLAYDRFTSDRLKFCSVCDRIFWARRKPTEYCERQRCIETYKKRKHREKKRGSK